MKKIFTLMLAFVAGIGTMFAESGTCGDLTWDLTDGVLTISGNGDIPNYTPVASYGHSSYPSPWYSMRASIVSVNIEDGVTGIGSNAFRRCQFMTSVKIPSSVTHIERQAFHECGKLPSINIPNGVVSIDEYAFASCTSLADITIGASVTEIAENAFDDCGSLPVIDNIRYADTYLVGVVDKSFSSYTIKEGTKWIGTQAFWNCVHLKSIKIPESVLDVGYLAFDACDSLPIIDNVRYADTYMKEVVDKGMPFTIKEGTKWIGNSAFRDCYNLDTIKIPNTIKSIGNWAFYFCGNLSYIEIPSNVTRIGEHAFDWCGKLTSVSINSNVVLSKWSASGTMMKDVFGEQVTEYILGDEIQTIGIALFSNCARLRSISIPNSVTSIEGMAFYGCTGLTSIEIPSSVTSIGFSAFYNVLNVKYLGDASGSPWGARCVNGYVEDNIVYNNEGKTNIVACSILTEGKVTVPNSVTYIGQGAFKDCTAMTAIEISSSVSDIGKEAFENCSSLTSIIVKRKNYPYIQSSTFSNINSNAVVYVPYGSLSKYKSAYNWNKMNIQLYGLNQEIQPAPTSCYVSLEVEDVELSSCKIENGDTFVGNTLEYTGLEPYRDYSNLPVVLTAITGETETITLSFTTTALELTTLQPKPVSSTTAILLAATNMSDAEASCGFEYKRDNAPDAMQGTKVYCPVSNGTMAGRLKNLKDDVYYKYRAFYQSAAGNMYYGDWQYIFTGDVTVEFDPVIYTYDAVSVKENEATLKGYAIAGAEDFTEQGFEYWAVSRVPQANNAPAHMLAALGEHKTVQATGIKMQVTLTDLDAGTIYKYRTYAKVGDQVCYGAEMTFTTKGVYEEEEGIDQITNDQLPITNKVIHNGQILILRGNKIYTISGQEIR